jgi:uroporphyrinogen decarboxylase
MNIGLVMHPDWLRKHLIPRYRQIFQPIKAKGVPILFMTDGNFLEVAADLKNAGADGFFLDTPCMHLESLVERCGRDLIYYTGPSPATLEIGSPHDVQEAVRRLAEIGRELPRFFFHMPGGWTHTMPVENVQCYYESCREYGQR